MEKESKYIPTPELARTSAEEFVQEFKDLVYPAYSSFGFTLPEALLVWKLNVISNQLSNIEEWKEGEDNDNWKEK